MMIRKQVAARRREPGSPCFRHFRSVSVMSQRHDELETMTELAAFLMALMFTVELAIAFGAAWLAARQYPHAEATPDHRGGRRGS